MSQKIKRIYSIICHYFLLIDIRLPVVRLYIITLIDTCEGEKIITKELH